MKQRFFFFCLTFPERSIPGIPLPESIDMKESGEEAGSEVKLGLGAALFDMGGARLVGMVERRDAEPLGADEEAGVREISCFSSVLEEEEETFGSTFAFFAPNSR